MADPLAEAKARAMAVAAKLNSLPGLAGGMTAASPYGPGAGASVLGKRGRDADESERKIFVPEKDFPDINFRGILIGPKGRHQQELQERTGAIVLIRGRGTERPGDPEEVEPMHVLLRGSEDAVARAATEVESILFNPQEALRIKRGQLQDLGSSSPVPSQSTYGPDSGRSGLGYMTVGGGGAGGIGAEISGPTTTMRVPDSTVGMIIGKAGSHLRLMASEYGVRVSVPRDSDASDPGFRTIELTGQPANTDSARRKIEHMLANERDERAVSSGHPINDIQAVPVDKVGKLIGRGGATISQIQNQFQCRVQIPPDPDPMNPGTKAVAIGCNSAEAMAAVRAEIQRIVASDGPGSYGGGGGGGGGAYGPSGAPGSTTVYYDIPDERVGAVIGKRGVNIQHLQNTTQTRIQIPNDAEPNINPPVRRASITGQAAAVEAARREIDMIISHMGPITMGGPMQGAPYGAPAGGHYGGHGHSAAQSHHHASHGQAHHGGHGAYGAQGGYAAQGAYGAQAAYAQYGTYAADPYAAQQQQHAQPYGQAHAAQGYSAYASAAQPQGQAQAYGQPVPATQAAAPVQAQSASQPQAGVAATAAAAAPPATDLTQYHRQFWEYAAHYGEEYSRTAYGVWAPPVGTSCPPDIVLPAPEQAAAAIAAAQATPAAGTDASGAAGAQAAGAANS